MNSIENSYKIDNENYIVGSTKLTTAKESNVERCVCSCNIMRNNVHPLIGNQLIAIAHNEDLQHNYHHNRIATTTSLSSSLLCRQLDNCLQQHHHQHQHHEYLPHHYADNQEHNYVADAEDAGNCRANFNRFAEQQHNCNRLHNQQQCKLQTHKTLPADVVATSRNEQGTEISPSGPNDAVNDNTDHDYNGQGHYSSSNLYNYDKTDTTAAITCRLTTSLRTTLPSSSPPSPPPTSSLSIIPTTTITSSKVICCLWYLLIILSSTMTKMMMIMLPCQMYNRRIRTCSEKQRIQVNGACGSRYGRRRKRSKDSERSLLFSIVIHILIVGHLLRGGNTMAGAVLPAATSIIGAASTVAAGAGAGAAVGTGPATASIGSGNAAGVTNIESPVPNGNLTDLSSPGMYYPFLIEIL